MTGARLLLWVVVSVLSTAALFGASYAAFSLGRGDWVAFFHSPAVNDRRSAAWGGGPHGILYRLVLGRRG
jgi:hypothetical protein